MTDRCFLIGERNITSDTQHQPTSITRTIAITFTASFCPIHQLQYLHNYHCTTSTFFIFNIHKSFLSVRHRCLHCTTSLSASVHQSQQTQRADQPSGIPPGDALLILLLPLPQTISRPLVLSSSTPRCSPSSCVVPMATVHYTQRLSTANSCRLMTGSTHTILSALPRLPAAAAAHRCLRFPARCLDRDNDY